jgi:ribose 5-phosphate isomerase A
MLANRDGGDGGEDVRRRAAAAAIAEVEPGMKLGLGSGRTAEHFVRLLAEKVRAGFDVVGVSTSERTTALALAEGVPLTTLDAEPWLDLAIDGADEIDPQLRLIKGGGGALLREKIVANAAGRMIVVAEKTKLVQALGAFPLPIEVIPFGLGATRAAIERAADGLGLAGALKPRMAGAALFVTDGGHYILDASFGRISDPDALARALDGIPGVVEHGLFIGLAVAALIGHERGVDRLAPRGNQ